MSEQRRKRWLDDPQFVAVWATLAAFGTYFCMYAFRKPFAAAEYAEAITLPVVGTMLLKDLLVIAQMLGYMMSKFIGIRVIAEMPPRGRARAILLLIGFAELTLLGFAVTPVPFNAGWLFLNGLSLGMVFGLVLGFLEGRRATEALAAGLCASFILADGVVKGVGLQLLTNGVAAEWMPFAAGACFLPPLLLGTWMLAQVPPPTEADVAERTERVPLDAVARRTLFWRYAPGLIAIVTGYLLISILRGFRSDFARELWDSLGYSSVPSLLATSEVYVALGVLLVNGLTVLIRDNRRAFFTAIAVSVLGLLLLPLSLWGLRTGQLSGFVFVVLMGLGLYLPYVAVHTTVFERFIAMTRDRGNVGYLMYVADAIGYLGYVLVVLLKSSGWLQLEFLPFFGWLTALIGGLTIVSFLAAALYFAAVRTDAGPG